MSEDVWFIYSPEADELRTYTSQQALEGCASKFIEECYLDGDSGWSDQVWFVVAGHGQDLQQGADEEKYDYENRIELMRRYKIVENVTDRVENYDDPNDWPYSSDYDYVCTYYIERLPE